MPTHVRVYTIRPGEVARFAEEWRAQVVPLRRRFGFEVTYAWASEDDDTFVWVVTRDGDDWEEAEQAYYDSPERLALDPDPAARIVEARAFFARTVDLR
jgi:NIPSNAP protein